MKVVPPNGPAKAGDTANAPEIEYSISNGLLARLAQLNISLAFTSYQSGLLSVLGRKPQGGLHLHQSAVAKPMGLCVGDNGRLTLASAAQIIRYENVLEPHERVN